MTQSPNNPPSDTKDAPPGRALRIARLLIALGLVVGIGVFAVFTIEELRAGSTTYAPPTDFGASDEAPALPATAKSGPAALADLAKLDPTRFPIIERPNPHPGEIVPFAEAAPLGQPPYYQAEAGEVWELCVYELRNASMTELIAYYNAQAEERGLRLMKQKPTSANMPGGIVTTWGDGKKSLQVTSRPMPVTEPITPPLAPPTPLRWVVKYSYPEPTPRP